MSGLKAAIQASRETGFVIRHDDETTVVRVITDPEHPEYDPRVELPVDENLVESLIRLGQLQQAVAYKDGTDDGKDVVVLVDGRQRWKAMQEAWNRFREEDRDMKLAPVFRIILRGQKGLAQRREIRISANRHRQELSGLALAQELRNHLDIVGESDEALEEARVVFNFRSLDALKNCLALLDTTEAVQEHLANGTLSPTGALQLSRQAPEVQDAVAGRISEQIEGGNGEEGEDDGDEDPEGDVAPEEPRNESPESSPEAPARNKPVPVSTVRDMIREETGQKTYAMVSVKQIEKEIDKKNRQLESALSKLEECSGNDAKTMNQAAKVAELQGYISALRWARGETASKSSEATSNDKASAAWDALREALINASWPKLLTRDDFTSRNMHGPDVTPEMRDEIIREQNEQQRQINDSRILVIAGEKVAWRDCSYDGSPRDLCVDTSTKWFQRLMDPFGNPSQLVRDFGAHGWLRDGSQVAGIQAWKTYSPFTKGKTAIKIDKVSDYTTGTSLAVTKSVEKLARCAIGLNVGKHSAALERENRFGSPWFEADCVGPDFEEDIGAREEIRNDLENDLEVNIPDDDCTWSTVGDLIDYVERKVAEKSEPTEGSDIQREGGA